jgi:hypothetical protein
VIGARREANLVELFEGVQQPGSDTEGAAASSSTTTELFGHRWRTAARRSRNLGLVPLHRLLQRTLRGGSTAATCNNAASTWSRPTCRRSGRTTRAVSTSSQRDGVFRRR